MGVSVVALKGGKRGRGKQKHCSVAIDGAMTIYDAVVNKDALLKALGGAAEQEIDLARIIDVPTLVKKTMGQEGAQSRQSDEVGKLLTGK